MAQFSQPADCLLRTSASWLVMPLDLISLGFFMHYHLYQCSSNSRSHNTICSSLFCITGHHQISSIWLILHLSTTNVSFKQLWPVMSSLYSTIYLAVQNLIFILKNVQIICNFSPIIFMCQVYALSKLLLLHSAIVLYYGAQFHVNCKTPVQSTLHKTNCNTNFSWDWWCCLPQYMCSNVMVLTKNPPKERIAKMKQNVWNGTRVPSKPVVWFQKMYDRNTDNVPTALKTEQYILRWARASARTARSANRAEWCKSIIVRKPSYRHKQMANCSEGNVHANQNVTKDTANRGPFIFSARNRLQMTDELSPLDITDDRYRRSLIHPNRGSLHEFQMRKMVSPSQNESLSIL